MPLHPLTNFEIQKYYQNEPKFNGVCSRSNLPKIKHGAYVINLEEYKSMWKSEYEKSCKKIIKKFNKEKDNYLLLTIFGAQI